jgi:hypothetical protein
MASLLRHAYAALGGARTPPVARRYPGPERRLPGPGRHRPVDAAGPGGRPEPAPVRPYAYQAARHYALNLIRDILSAVVPGADTAALLNWGCQTPAGSC